MHGNGNVNKGMEKSKSYSVVSVVSAGSLGLLALPASLSHVETADNAKEKSAGKRGDRVQEKGTPSLDKIPIYCG